MNHYLVPLCVIAFNLVPIADAKVMTVCRSGCAYQTVERAISEAEPGDTIRLAARETFEGNFVLPRKTGRLGVITIESTEVNSLPRPGNRIQPNHAQFMPRLIPRDPLRPVLALTKEEQHVASIQGSTNTIVFGGNHGFQENDPISFWSISGPNGAIAFDRLYYVRLLSPTAIQIRTVPDGTVVPLGTTNGSGLRVALAAAGSNYVLRGLELSAAPGRPHQYGLVELGGIDASHRDGLPDNVTLDRVYIHGLLDQNGPRHCLMLNARRFAVLDSRIEHCNKEYEESKGIAAVQAPGPGIIRNNYIEGASINILFGGDYVRISGLVSGDRGGINIQGNHFFKPLRLKYTQGQGGTTNPQGYCPSGNYLNTATGIDYSCENNTWVRAKACSRGQYFRRTDVPQSCSTGACWACNDAARYEPTSIYRGGTYLVKNLFEIKSGINFTIQGNVFENNWPNGDQSGIAVWVVSQVRQGNATPWARGENILFRNNIIRNSSQGIRIASEGPSWGFGMKNRNVRVVNNLLYDIGKTETPSFASDDARPVSFGGECIDCEFSNNTVVSDVSRGVGVYWDTHPMERFRFANNVLYNNQYGLLGDRGYTLNYYTSGAPLERNVVITGLEQPNHMQMAFGSSAFIGKAVPLFRDGAAKDFRLRPDSPFSSTCTTSCAFAGTDGADVGVRFSALEQETSGAVLGVPSAREQLQVRVSPTFSSLLIRYSPPNIHQVCSLRASESPKMSPLHEDVDPRFGFGANSDNRPGNFFAGNPRTFVLGFRVPLRRNTPYFYELTCGANTVYGSASTLP
jgi:hypothetical protein